MESIKRRATDINAIETGLKTIRINTPTYILGQARFDIFSVHAGFVGKNSGPSGKATKHFCLF